MELIYFNQHQSLPAESKGNHKMSKLMQELQRNVVVFVVEIATKARQTIARARIFCWLDKYRQKWRQYEHCFLRLGLIRTHKREFLWNDSNISADLTNIFTILHNLFGMFQIIQKGNIQAVELSMYRMRVFISVEQVQQV